MNFQLFFCHGPPSWYELLLFILYVFFDLSGGSPPEVMKYSSQFFTQLSFNLTQFLQLNSTTKKMLNDAEINSLIEKRNVARKDKLYGEADKIKQLLRENVPGIKILDTPFKQGGGSTWHIEVVLPSNVSLVELSKEVFKINDPYSDSVANIVTQAKRYCDLCEQHRGLYESNLRPTDAQGRQWADAAFHFAMGGVRDEGLYAGLVEGARAELKRVGYRNSFRTIDIIQMAEKFACAGVCDQSLYRAASELIKEKIPGGAALPDSLEDLQSGKYTLLSDRPLFALFRFAARQSKHGRQRVYDVVDYEEDDEEDEESEGEGEGDNVAADHSLDLECPDSQDLPTDFDVNSLFEDPTLPLVLDLGCGYGVSLLGLSYTASTQGGAARAKHNYLGCDMSARSMNFANSISHRWGLASQCAFVVCDVLKGLRVSQQYTGPVLWVSINFPTPYRQTMMPDMLHKYSLSAAENSSDDCSATLPAPEQAPCNSQLPSLISDFMVTSEMFQLIEDLVCSSFNKHSHQKSYLYLQSNVQDVAIVMNGMLLDHHVRQHGSASPKLSLESETAASGASFFGSDAAVCSISPSKKRKLEDSPVSSSKRQLLWAAQGGKTTLKGFTTGSSQAGQTAVSSTALVLQESADFWLEQSPLPILAKTETEVMCKFSNKPVFRQLFSYARRI